MKIAFIFPGRGSQYVGMAKEFIENFEESREVFTAASSVLGYDLAQLCLHGPAEKLNLTENTQPAILAASIAALRPLERRGLTAGAAAGHSLGEYTAITAAGGFELKDAIALVRKRGRYMQEAVPEGAGLMAAILGMERQDVEKTCHEAAKNGIVAPANYNSPGQIVIAGEKKAVEKAMELARAAGAKKVVPLAVSVPSHCAMMGQAGERLAKELEKITIRDLRIPIVNNAEAKFLRSPGSSGRLSSNRSVPPSSGKTRSTLWRPRVRHLHRDRARQGAFGPRQADRKKRKSAERGRRQEHERHAQQHRLLKRSS